ncbi:MAG: glycosyltransferase, partial [Acidobacteriota bacterium]
MAVILVVTSAPPLVEGGHIVIARALQHALVEAGHRATIATTPSNRFGRQASAYLANWLTDVGQTGDGDRIDQVISLRYPSFAVRHPRHVSWLNHTMREYYDLWDEFSAGLSPQGRIKERARRAVIHAADTYFLKRVSKRFVQSETIRARLQRWNHLDAEVLHPPAPPRAYRCDGYGDYLFFASRLDPIKRADLVIRAMTTPAARNVRCVIGGDGSLRPALEALARELDVDRRLTFAGRLDDEGLTRHLAACR